MVYLAVLLSITNGVCQEVYGTLKIPGYNWSMSYTTADGLPSSEVHSLYQDSRGHIWLSTDQGLCSFDSEDWTIYTSLDGMPDNMVQEIREDSSGNIWVLGLNQKIFYIDSTRETVVLPTFSNYIDSISLSYRVEDWTIDQHGNGTVVVKENGRLPFFLKNPDKTVIYTIFHIGNFKVLRSEPLMPFEAQLRKGQYANSGWIYNLGQMANELDHTHFEKDGIEYISVGVALPGFANRKVLNRQVEFLELDKNRLLVAYNQELLEIGIATGEVFSRHQFDQDIVALHWGTNGFLWIGLNHGGGMVCFQNSDSLNLRSDHLKGYSVTSFVEDNLAAIWVGTIEKGVLRFSNTIFEPLELPNGDSILSSVSEKRSDCIAIMDKKTPYRIQYQNGKLEWERLANDMYNLNDFWLSSDAMVSVFGRTNNLYISLDQVNWTLTNATLPVFQTIPAANGRVFGFSNKGYSLWDLQGIRLIYASRDLDLRPRVECALQLNENQFLIGTRKGVNLVGSDGYYEEFKPNILPKAAVNDLLLDKDSNIWVSLKGHGLLQVRMSSDSFSHYTRSNGLPLNFVKDIELVNGLVFGTTNAGLFSVDINRGPSDSAKIETWNVFDGLPTNELLALNAIGDILIIETTGGPCSSENFGIKAIESPSSYNGKKSDGKWRS